MTMDREPVIVTEVDDSYTTALQAAEDLEVTQATIRRWAHQGKFKFKMVDRRMYVEKVSLVAFAREFYGVDEDGNA